MKNSLSFILLLVLSFSNASCGSSDENTTDQCYDSSAAATTTSASGSYPVVDTRQALCFDSTTGIAISCTGTGDTFTAYDADFTGNSPSYTLNGGGETVTDNVTGLTWAQGTDTNGDGFVNDSDKMTQTEAVAYCDSLTVGGYSDWRLPDIKTLYSLMDFTGGDPSSYQGTDTSGLTPFINSIFDWAFGDQAAGERIIDGQYVSSTSNLNPVFGDSNPSDAFFGVNFVDGRIKSYPCMMATNRYYVRCVRGNVDYGLNNFTDNGDGTISDSATGLMWEKSDTKSTDWDNAIQVCKDSNTGSYTDWRLPNVKELQSIVDYSRSPDTSTSAAIDPAFNSTLITNEEGADDWPYYWASTTHKTYTGDGHAGTYVSFGRGLGYFMGNIQDVHGAGAQRSNYKTNVASTPGAQAFTNAYGTFYYHGPQGDILRENNYVRCVR